MDGFKHILSNAYASHAHATHFWGSPSASTTDFFLFWCQWWRGGGGGGNLMLLPSKTSNWDKANQLQTLHNPVRYDGWMLRYLRQTNYSGRHSSMPKFRHLMHTILLRFARIHIHHINNVIENGMKIEYWLFWYEKSTPSEHNCSFRAATLSSSHLRWMPSLTISLFFCWLFFSVVVAIVQ